MRISTFSGSLLLSLSLVEAAKLAPGNGNGSGQGGAATATLAPQHAGGPPSILPAPLKYHRRQLHGGNAFGLDRKKIKRQDPPADASISPDGQTASMPESGQSTADPDVEDGLPPECEAACAPFNKVVTQCGTSENSEDVSCECQASTFQAFVDCAGCAPALYSGYPGGAKGFVTGALEECKQAGITVDFDTSSLPGTDNTTYTGPSDNELSASAASASSALAAAGGSVGEASPASASPSDSRTSAVAGGKSTATPASQSGTSSSSAGNNTSFDSGAATANKRIEGTVAAAGLAAIALAAFAGLL